MDVVGCCSVFGSFAATTATAAVGKCELPYLIEGDGAADLRLTKRVLCL